MDLGDLVAKEGIVPSLNATTKKQSLQELARHAAEMTGIPQRDVFDALLQRERLGSTGLGRGIAVPHVKFKSLKSIVCIFARIDTPIDFEAADGDAVDLVFLLLAPEHASGDHLKALARVSRLLREPEVSAQLRSSRDADTLLSVLRQPATPHAA